MGDERRPKFTIYKDKANEWRWTLIDTNHKKIADSAEGYSRLNAILKAIENVKHEAPYAELEVKDVD